MPRAGGIAASLVLIAIGAILTWAVTADAEGFNVNTIGVILFVAGILGLIVVGLGAAGAFDPGGSDGTLDEAD